MSIIEFKVALVIEYYALMRIWDDNKYTGKIHYFSQEHMILQYNTYGAVRANTMFRVVQPMKPY
jgi:hypothetical protein